jgi:hypothetical protein
VQKYPSFTGNYLTTILNTDPRWSEESANDYIRGFITAYRPLYDSSQKVFSDFSPYEKEIEKATQYVKYYFPKYKTPTNILTYIGPLDGFGDIIAEDAFIVALHHHLGNRFSLYSSPMVHDVYPAYISNRFEPAYISVNCMKNIVNDMYPEKYEDKSLVFQMVENGKRLFLLSLFLPEKEEHMLIGYTKKQMQDSYAHEKVIWDLFVQNNLLQNNDNNIVSNYIGESPKTKELGDASPGNIGSFAGWQIVKKYMKENEDEPVEKMMGTSAETIFEKAKYKP